MVIGSIPQTGMLAGEPRKPAIKKRKIKLRRERVTRK